MSYRIGDIHAKNLNAIDSVTCKNITISEGFKIPKNVEQGYILQSGSNGNTVWTDPDLINSASNVIASGDFGSNNRLTKTVGAVGKEIEATDITVTDSNDVSGINDLTVSGELTLGSGSNAYSFPSTKGVEDEILTVDNSGNLVFTTPTGGGGGGSPIVASFVDNDHVVTKPSSASVIHNVTGMSYEMESGKTYYVKMFFNHQGGNMTGGSTDEFVLLSHTPWASTASVEKGFIGTNWGEVTGGGGPVYSNNNNALRHAYESDASKSLANFLGDFPYAGFCMIEGMLTAPTTATFTPTITYIGGGTGTMSCSFQGYIMEMPP